METIPADLREIVKEVKSARATKDFRGIASKSYLQWLSVVGHKNKDPATIKTFRLRTPELQLLQFFKSAGITESDAVREGLKLLKESFDRNRSNGDC